MMSTRESKSETWQQWEISEWNETLFLHFFSAMDGDDAPATRIVMTPEELKRAVGDDMASPNDVHDAFLGAMRARLRVEKKTLCADARTLERTHQNGQVIPPFFAHLTLTCLTASDADDEVREEGNFRKRLNTLLGREDPGPNYHLNDLPKLCRKLAVWLNEARKRGEAYRELVLPDPGRMVRIGYSVNLTFPPRRDQTRMVNLLAEQELNNDPPIPTVLEIVGGNIGHFSETFRRAFEDFLRVYGTRDVDPYQLFRHPFWSAVRDAVQRPPWHRDAEHRSDVARALLRLEDLEDFEGGRFALTLQVDSDRVDDPESGIRTEPTEFPIGDFAYIPAIPGEPPNPVISGCTALAFRTR